MWVDLVRVPPSGTWERRRADLFGLAEDWIGPPAFDGDPVEHLVARYLRAFGPASRKDVASFTGLKLGRAQAGVRGARARAIRDGGRRGAARRARRAAAGRRRRRRRCGSCRRGTRRCSCTPGGRSSCRSASARSSSTCSMPQSVPTFMVDGAVAGTWKWVDGEIVLDAFEPLAAGALDEVRGGGRAARRLPRLTRRVHLGRPVILGRAAGRTSTAAGWGGWSGRACGTSRKRSHDRKPDVVLGWRALRRAARGWTSSLDVLRGRIRLASPPSRC